MATGRRVYPGAGTAQAELADIARGRGVRDAQTLLEVDHREQWVATQHYFIAR